MKYLLDTHTLIWTLLETTKLSGRAADAISDQKNKIYVSPITFWEICIKMSCGKLALGSLKSENLPEICTNWGFELLMLTPHEASTFEKLAANHHKDPFDRILVWQAIYNDLALVTDDRNIQKYVLEGLQVVW